MVDKEKLSQDDIKALMEHPDTDTKIDVIKKLSKQYTTEDFTDAQVKLAEQIFRLLLRQAEIEVRRALSENIMYSRMIPHDVVLSLAKDVEEVALPVLEFSEVLTDDDLIEIIKSTEKIASKIAIAKREHVSKNVSTALIDVKDEDVVDTLLQNEGAEIADKSFKTVVDTFPHSERIVESMITHGSIPSTIITQMTEKVSGVIQKKLEKKYKGSFNEISTFFQESSEVASLKFMGMRSIDNELMDLVDDLEREKKLEQALHPVHGMLTQLLDGMEQLGKLTPISALAMGHLTLFEISLSRLTGVPHHNVHKLAQDSEGGLTALYEKAQLPPKLFDAIKFVVEVIREMNKEAEETGMPKAREDLNVMIKNIINQSKGKKIKNLAHFISIVRHHIESGKKDEVKEA